MTTTSQKDKGIEVSDSFTGVFRRCVEGSSDAIMITDVKGTILYVNRAWEGIYGFSRAEAIGGTPRLLRSGVHDKEFYQQMWAQILDPKKGYWKGEVVNRTKAGEMVPMLLTISPYRDDNKALLGYMSLGVDIREKKLLEAQIIRQDRLASIGMLSSGLAHEVGTPLGVIRGRAEYLLMDTPENSAQRTSLEIIIAQIDRISKLIYSLLNLARVGPAEGTTPVVLENVIRDVETFTSQAMKKERIRFESKVGSDVIVRAEGDRLEQVFLNLCMNAIHAIEFAVQDGRRDGHAIQVEAVDKGKMWEISLEDTGCGISKENMNHLFKPFFTTKEVGSGTGLGLAITHQIIQSWGGNIWAEPRPGHGVRFKFLLPKAEQNGKGLKRD